MPNASKQRKQHVYETNNGVRKQETKITERSQDLPPGIAKVTVNTSQTQLAWARPVKKRKGSTASSNTSTVARGSSTTSLQQPSIPTTPLPLYSPPHEAYLFPPGMQQPQRQSPPNLPLAAPQYVPPVVQEPQIQSTTVTARRRDKVTPSFYSFATDSTKLGEIPMRKWAVPFDQAQADRLNAEALANGWRPQFPPATMEQQQKGRSKLMRLFGRGRRNAAQQQVVH